MATCEYYAKATVPHPTMPEVEATIGIEYRAGDDVDDICHVAVKLAEKALVRYGARHSDVAEYARELIREAYPDRAFFVESEEEYKRARFGVQVYQPFGMPRELCAACGGKLCG